MSRFSMTVRTAVALVLATSAAYAGESGSADGNGTTTTTVTESGSNGGRTFRRQTTVTRSSSSSRNRSSGAGKNSSSVRKRTAPFKAGDEVLLARAGDIFAAKVVGVDRSSGWVKVKYEDDGGPTTQALPPDHLTPARRNGKRLLTSDPGQKGDFRVGDEVLTAFGGVHIAEVVEISGNGWVKVKFDDNGLEMTPTLPPNKLRLIEGEQVSLADGALLRTWSSQGGKFTVEAKFVELRGDSLLLETEGGKTLTVALDKLDDDDRELARRLAEAEEDDSRAAKRGKK
ncbi:MAG TPA: SHD1 domain-containing protein [Pirellulales bacterium]|jgi:hypothetical protein|nr:SHD1 domain-containing protein [Pirellulales bacterium]